MRSRAVIAKPTRLIPEEVRFLRKVLGLSGADFAKRMGVDPTTVSRWETGMQPIGPQADRLLRLIAPEGHFVAYGLGWGMFDYRERKVMSFGGTMHDFSSHGGLMEEENLGVVVLCNMGAPGLPPALMKRIFDAYLGAPERDWSRLALDQVKTSREKEQAEEQKVEAARIKGTKPSLPLNRYAGTYADRAYGTVQVSEDGEGLVLRFPGAQVADLKHWHYDLFRMSLRGPAPPCAILSPSSSTRPAKSAKCTLRSWRIFSDLKAFPNPPHESRFRLRRLVVGRSRNVAQRVGATASHSQGDETAKRAFESQI